MSIKVFWTAYSTLVLAMALLSGMYAIGYF